MLPIFECFTAGKKKLFIQDKIFRSFLKLPYFELPAILLCILVRVRVLVRA